MSRTRGPSRRPADLVHGGLAMLACVLATGLAGCLFIPTAEHGLMDGRGIIEEADTAFLADDTTLREDVVLRFGEPDLVIDQGRFLVYHWSRVQGYLFLGGGYTGQLIPLERNHFLVLEFDEAGHVKEFELTGRLPASLSSRTAKGKWRDTVQRKHIVIDPVPEALAGPDAPGIATPAIRLGMASSAEAGLMTCLRTWWATRPPRSASSWPTCWSRVR
jgi:hypothetical protein